MRCRPSAEYAGGSPELPPSTADRAAYCRGCRGRAAGASFAAWRWSIASYRRARSRSLNQSLIARSSAASATSCCGLYGNNGVLRRHISASPPIPNCAWLRVGRAPQHATAKRRRVQHHAQTVADVDTSALVALHKSGVAHRAPASFSAVTTRVVRARETRRSGQLQRAPQKVELHQEQVGTLRAVGRMRDAGQEDQLVRAPGGNESRR